MRDFVVSIPVATSVERQYLAEQICDAGDNLGIDLSTIDITNVGLDVWVSASSAEDAILRIRDALEESYGTDFGLTMTV